MLHESNGLAAQSGSRCFGVQVVALVRDGGAPLAGRRISRSADVYAVRDFCTIADREDFRSVLLDNKYRIIGVEEGARGSLTAAVVHPREVYKAAILSNAAALVFVHNRSSGCPLPSAGDIEITGRPREAADLLGIHVIDHVVIGTSPYMSFADDGFREGNANG